MKNRILVVEDERIISDLICMNLEAAGYETRAVYDGSEAAGLLREQGQLWWISCCRGWMALR